MIMTKRLVLFIALVALLVPVWAQEDTQSETDADEPALELVKAVSVDGGLTWDDAQVAPGPRAEIGADVFYQLTVTNNGLSVMTDIVLTDDSLTLDCPVPAQLNPGQSFYCTIGPVTAQEGQALNTASVSVSLAGTNVTVSDAAYYYGGDVALISIEKMAGIGGVWYTADEAPGLIVPSSEQVSFRIVVTNDGTQTFTNISLTDSQYDLSGCAIPEELPSGLSLECLIGPFEVDEDDGQQENVATVSASAGDVTVTATDSAFYKAREPQDGAIIIIEGPIEFIDGNIIIIFGQIIELDPNDPILLVIHIGDVIRVEGDLVEGDGVVVIIAIIVIVIDVDIIIVDDDHIWRDDGQCANPPPPWAPAHGWRRKCQGTTYTGNVLPPGLRKKNKNK